MWGTPRKDISQHRQKIWINFDIVNEYHLGKKTFLTMPNRLMFEVKKYQSLTGFGVEGKRLFWVKPAIVVDHQEVY